MSTAYNWRNTLTRYASISGVLAGFCVSSIGIVLGLSVADTSLYKGITYGHVSVLLFGISASLFISSAEFFLISKNFDLFDLTKNYMEWLEKDFDSKGENWHEIRNTSHEKCRLNERYGRYCYNASIFVMFSGLGFAIASYNLPIAIIVTTLGITLELVQAIVN